MASLITEQLEALHADTADGDASLLATPPHVLFSAHGVPVSYISEQNDPYQRHIEDCVQLISHAVREKYQSSEVVFDLSYQSRVGPIEWLRPYTDDMLRSLAEAGVRRLVVVPISFVSEHIETLEEIDMEYREVAEEAGITHWRRVPALNTDDAFIAELASLVGEAIASPSMSVSEVCVSNNCDLTEGPGALLGLMPGVTNDAETVNGRAAMVGLMGTFFLELFSGRDLMHVFGVV